MLRKLPVALSCGLTLLMPACADSGDGGDSNTASRPAPVELLVGGIDPEDKSIVVMAFLPARATVAVGDVVEWTFPGPVAHTVTFLRPGQPRPQPAEAGDYVASVTPRGGFDGSHLANSGRRPSDTLPEPYRLQFAKAGEYAYICVLHPRMAGTIVVNDVDTQVPERKSIAAAAEHELSTALREAHAAKQTMTRGPSAPTTSSDGGRSFTVEMGTSTAKTEVLAFAPASLAVAPGDRVTFVNNSFSEHTASFGDDLVPRDRNSPRAREPSPGPSPQPLVSDFFLSTGAIPGAVGDVDTRSYTFVAAAPGSYGFVCIFHQGRGMTGTITVT